MLNMYLFDLLYKGVTTDKTAKFRVFAETLVDAQDLAEKGRQQQMRMERRDGVDEPERKWKHATFRLADVQLGQLARPNDEAPSLWYDVGAFRLLLL